MMTDTAIEKLLLVGRAQQQVDENPDGNPYVILPGGQVLDMSHLFPPRRVKQQVSFVEADSFIGYVNAFKSPHSLIFANLTERDATFTAVLDYHQAAAGDPPLPDYCQHQATFTTLPTPEFTTWMNANRQTMNQVDFATWVEDNIKLFVSPPESGMPTGAELLQLVKTLHGHKNARFNTLVRLDNGAYSAAYEEDIIVTGNSAGTKADSLPLPGNIMGGFAVFQGSAPYRIPARLRHYVDERRLKLRFETIGVPQLIRENIMDVCKLVAEKTSIVPLLGSIVPDEPMSLGNPYSTPRR